MWIILWMMGCTDSESGRGHSPDADGPNDTGQPPIDDSGEIDDSGTDHTGEKGTADIPNLIDWGAVSGIEGGIPEREPCVVLSSIDGTGATDVLADVQAALDACTPGQAVVLPEGRFLLDGSLWMRSNVTLRGSGPGTVLDTRDTIWFNDGLGKVNVDVVDGSATGSEALTLASEPDGLTVGSTFLLSELNDETYVHPYGYEEDATAPLLCSYCDEPDGGTRVRSQMARVTAIDGTRVEFTPPLYSDFAPEREPRITFPEASGDVNVLVHAGLEDLKLDPVGSHTVVRLEQAQNCWLSDLTVEINADDVPAIHGYFAHRIAIEHSTFNGHTPTSQAILSQIHTEGWRVENNIFTALSLVFLNVGRQGGHVFAYNYVSSNVNVTTALINDSGNHGSHPQYLLWEGNKMAKHHADSIHGSSSHTTLFRNHFRCRWDDTTFGAGCIWIDSWNYYYNTVGNVLGLPGMTDWVYDVESPAELDDTLYIYRYGYSGYNPYDEYPLSKDTTLRHGNYDYGRDVVEWSDSIEDQALPPSLYLDAKPAWFGTLRWPATGPDVEGYATELIPAEYRYVHGTDPP